MIDTSKLKYYKTLCEKGVLYDQQNDLDDIMNTLEEKQFEYLKRLETAKDEGRKDEINELLNTIEVQLKELVAIKTTLSAGIIIENTKEVTNNKDYVQAEGLDTKTQKVDNLASTTKQKKEKGNTKIIIAIGVLACVIAVSAIAITNSINSLKNSPVDGKVESASDTTTEETTATNSEEENRAYLGVNGIDDGVNAQSQFEEQGPEDQILTEGYYIFDITNKSLIDGGLELGDKLLSLNGEKILIREDLKNIVARYNPGDEAILVVERNHEEMTIKGVFAKESELLADRTGKGSFKINGRTFEFDYDEAILTLKAEP